MTGGWTRRTWLSFLAGLPAAWGIRPGAMGSVDGPVRREAQALVGALGAPRSAARIGRWYLDLEPAEADVALLVRLLRTSVGDGVPMPAGSRDLEAAIRRDFARGDTVAIGGWLLARTEVRTCALAALLREG